MTQVKDKYQGATLREAQLVARHGKLARSPLFQAAMRLRGIDDLIAEVEAYIAAFDHPLAALEQTVAEAEEIFQLCRQRGMHKLQAFHNRQRARALLWEWQAKLKSDKLGPRPAQARELLEHFRKARRSALGRYDNEYALADRSTRQRVKDLLARTGKIDDPKADSLLVSVKNIAIADSITPRLDAESYWRIGHIGDLPLTDPAFRCALTPEQIEGALRSTKGRTEAKELMRKANSMGLWLDFRDAYREVKPRPCSKCGKLITEPRKRICDACYVEKHNCDNFLPVIDWIVTPNFIRWPRGIKEKASWQRQDEWERFRATCELPENKPVSEQKWDYSHIADYLYAHKSRVGTHVGTPDDNEIKVILDEDDDELR
jgi:hypothetical protein